MKVMTTPINHWPIDERPRERLLKKGATYLTDAELIAILFGHGYKQKNALTLAQEALAEFSSLYGILTADTVQLEQIKGLGTAKVCQLQACAEIAKRFLAHSLTKKSLNSAQLVTAFLQSKMRDYTQEVFACLYLDCKNQYLHFEPLFFGSIRSIQIYPREIAKRALRFNAANLIVSHNHPSGNAHPSQADIDMTQHLQRSLQLLDIQLLDHIIVGHNNTVSLYEHGFM